MEKRYIATVEFFVFAETDEKAIEQVKEFCKSQDRVKDNKCSPKELVEQPFGKLHKREIYFGS